MFFYKKIFNVIKVAVLLSPMISGEKSKEQVNETRTNRTKKREHI